MSKNYNYEKRHKEKLELNPSYSKDIITENSKVYLSRKVCIFLVIIIAIILAILMKLKKYEDNPIIEDGKLIREYSQIIGELEEEPEDITKTPYKENMPKILKEDIKRMKSSKNISKIVYKSSQDTSKIIIAEKDGVIFITTIGQKDNSDGIYEVSQNISFYKNGENIVIYGSYKNYRSIHRYECEDKRRNRTEANYNFDIDSIDLFGVNQEFDDERKFRGNMTLVRKGNQMMFYRLGKQVGKTETFPGKDIVKFEYDYILDSNSDLYYMYYCVDLENPWVHFVKVAENVDKVTNEVVKSSDEKDFNIEFSIYIKDGKKYAGISDFKTERAYGQNYGNSEKNGINPNFNITTIEILKDKVLNAALVESKSSFDDTSWYIRYNFDANGQKVWISKRVDGLDSGLTSRISETELSKFEKTIDVKDIKNTIEELKDLYKRYEQNEF